MPRDRHALAARLLGGLLLVTGTLHFVVPHGYESIVPGFLGSPAFWVHASGFAELACAVGLFVERLRLSAGLATAVLFVAVFPANVQMAYDVLTNDDRNLLVTLGVLVRLPLQLPLIWWALYSARPGRPAPPPRPPYDGAAA